MPTERQGEILQTIHKYIKTNGISPTVRGLCDLVGLKSSSTVHKYLSYFQQKGYITKMDTIPRSIRITEKGLDLLEE